MTIHKLTAGSGYDYLTRQVARQDATEVGHAGLASYYTERGETPGVWMGSGMVGIIGLGAGDTVKAEHMQNLFGYGIQPLGEDVATLARRDGPDADEADLDRVMLGRAYPVIKGDLGELRKKVAGRLDKINRAKGLPVGTAVDLDTRARVRTEVATEMFRDAHGRDPLNERELAGLVARASRPSSTAVAGYDLAFSPVKSVSALWAVADQGTAAKIELAHQAAVKDALSFIEQHALFTRTGTGGARQVDVTGLVATAFTHRDSRAGDPDLHTHVAVANKVQTLDGKWLSIDGRVLFKATVTASETYNTALEQHLARLGLRFEDRPSGDARTRPVREVVGVPAELNERWSSRRADIEARRDVLAQEFQARHGRPPTAVEAVKLAQQATLQTRQDKHAPRTLAEQRTQWAAEARHVLGSQERVHQVVSGVLAQGPRGRWVHPGQEWVDRHAGQMIGTIAARRATWQVWHVRAEAERVARSVDVPLEHASELVDELVHRALATHSIALAKPRDVAAVEPEVLRRRDGSSVYTVAGSQLFTSLAVLQAEQFLLEAAGRTGGRVAPETCVGVALLELEANGVRLNPGQASLVRRMATSGSRVQLAIAPAGAGKTTAMAALTRAWEASGGTVVGLAPSAAAAGQLRDQTGASTDTLAALTHHLTGGQSTNGQALAAQISRGTLVLIDEAGMSDTLSLHTAVEYALDRGASVRLVGDDQQLAAIGAGGVLRDIDATHGSVRLTELMRFTDRAEGAASLALRQGDTAALGFYLDEQRVHVGDTGTMADRVFAAWKADTTTGCDSIMLAPTRELASHLNQRARADRLAADGEVPVRTRTLADGNQASPGDLIITRSNNRSLRTSATDFVKNGDRWHIIGVKRGGDLVVRHRDTRRRIVLPASYVDTHTELGYASTVHTAQGLSVDTMHGLIGGGESRQQFYTMMTRGRTANHAYLEVVGDGDPHTLIQPRNTIPPTATDILEGILARDDAPRSVHTLVREEAAATTGLGHAATRYVDALTYAAEQRLGTAGVHRLERAADLVPELTQSPAWPTLRAHLILLSAHDVDPVAALRQAAVTRELDTAADPAAVLGWRLDDSGLRNAGPGPLPWLPGIPASLAADPTWSDYLSERADLVRDLAEQVSEESRDADTPSWARQGTQRPEPELLARVQVWRAANQVEDTDLRPTGPRQIAKAHALHQQDLDTCLRVGRHPAIAEFGPLITAASPATHQDRFAPVLAERLAGLSRAGLDAPATVQAALSDGPLPDDHACAALWWRINRTLSPAVATEMDTQHALATDWQHLLADHVGTARATAMQDSPWWPALVTTVEQATARGWPVTDLLHQAAADGARVDDAQAMTWRISLLTSTPPTEDDHHTPQEDQPPMDLYDHHGEQAPPEHAPTDDELLDHLAQADLPDDDLEPAPDPTPPGHQDEESPAVALALLARIRDLGPDPLEYSEAELARQWDRAQERQESPVPVDRLAAVSAMALDYFESRLVDDSGWARDYLADRFGHDIAGHRHVRPGYAPAGWTHLVDHLRGHGVSDLELETTGLAFRTRTGNLIDRFRDRAVMPVMDQDQVLGFMGRRNPARGDDEKAGPKYLNTPSTPLFRKGDHLYGTNQALLDAGAVPVLVEGLLDAHAVTLATRGTCVGVTPLGTALTEAQARQLAQYSDRPLVATDGDLAGQMAAHRDYWLLAQHGATPQLVTLPDGSDPAGILERRGPDALTAALRDNRSPLSDALLDERLTHLTRPQALGEAASVLATTPSDRWDHGVTRIAVATGTDRDTVRAVLVSRIRDWNQDPRGQVEAQLGQVRQVRDRTAAEATSPAPGPALATVPSTYAHADRRAVRGGQLPGSSSPRR
ncbi:MobF family relaxase [uncultured Serinicoccus sp.]|uniref:MobF family relaxase n=1 Tax=uncultured Serinicoccus sp. TaxID=735514 RepID=UPI00261926DD|nr:MobF family relaxase [uncultured Serinicoccus sp.]